MTDIVERLRSRSATNGGMFPDAMVLEAADEIERLREALRFYACTCAKGGCNDEEKEYPGCGSKARTALGEKD